MNRETALALLHEHITSDSLRKHCLAVEEVMRRYAEYYGESPSQWALCGLLHDLDFEKYPAPETHGVKTAELLAPYDVDQEILDAIAGHSLATSVPRTTRMAKALLACDELTGFIFAVVKILPSKSISDLKVKSVKKKLKNRKFAAAIDREEIDLGIAELGVDLDEHIQFTIDALSTAIAPEIGLAGVSETNGEEDEVC